MNQVFRGLEKVESRPRLKHFYRSMLMNMKVSPSLLEVNVYSIILFSAKSQLVVGVAHCPLF